MDCEILAISSLTAGRIGIQGFVSSLLFLAAVIGLIHFLSRHEYDPAPMGVIGTAIVVQICGAIGKAAGAGLGSVIGMVAGCFLAALVVSGPFLGFRVPHRLVLAAAAPVFHFAASLGGFWIERAILENALR